jgi:hypothetical protein
MDSNHHRGKIEPKEDVTSENLKKKRHGDTPIDYSG